MMDNNHIHVMTISIHYTLNKHAEREREDNTCYDYRYTPNKHAEREMETAPTYLLKLTWHEFWKKRKDDDWN